MPRTTIIMTDENKTDEVEETKEEVETTEGE